MTGSPRAGRLLAAGGLLLALSMVVSGCFLFDPCAWPDPGLECEDGQLIITEVSSCPFIDVACWLELYNYGTGDAELADYSLRVEARFNTDPWNYPDPDNPVAVLTLPALTVPPGAYAVVRAEQPWLEPVDAGMLIHVSNGGVTPSWSGSSGFLELLHGTATADFVAWGASSEAPAQTSHWDGGAAPSLPSGSGNYGRSIARSVSNTDSNAAADWHFRDFATPGGPNDVTSHTDADLDGIPDSAESPGGTFAGLPLYAWGARTGQRDIFVHVDYMVKAGDPGVMTRCEALDQVVAAFDARGINLQFDVGDLCDPAGGTDPANHDLDDTSHEVPYRDGIALGDTGGSHANLYAYKNRYMDLARKQILHYLVFGNSQNARGAGGSSGFAEFVGNDLIVTLGGWGLQTTPPSELNRLINYQAGTLMHELGHNLGLEHGGDEGRNYKPNYLSVMNYLYQLDGVATIGNNEGDRYLCERRWFLSATPCDQSLLVDGPLAAPATFSLDFSDGTGGSVGEPSLDEKQGLARAGSGWVDYDDDSVVDNHLLDEDINFDGSIVDTHTDFDDWGNLNLFFVRSLSGHAEGVSGPPRG